MKATASFILVSALIIMLVSGLALAQSGTYEEPPQPPAEGAPPARPEEPVYNVDFVDELDMIVGDTLILIADPEPFGSSVVWISANPEIATVRAFSPSARVTAQSVGTTVITVRALSPRQDGSFWQGRVTINVTKTSLPTPRTAGGSALFIPAAYLLLMGLIFLAVNVIFKIGAQTGRWAEK